MLIKRTVLSLILLSLTVQADILRREPSLFLEYERELKKVNDSQQHDDMTFIKAVFPLVVAKPTPPLETIIKPIPLPETTTVLKNVKVDTDKIGENEKLFLKVAKPTPIDSVALCPNDAMAAEASKSTSQKIIKNLNNVKVKILSRAKEFLGTPYGFGDKEGGRTDCSGFTQQVYRPFGITLPRSASEQAQFGENVQLSDLQIGDLLFYRTYKSDPSHVAIYAGNGQIIHASYAANRVQYDSINKAYYKNRFMYARRLNFNDTDHDE
jgi:cell wall-associated NlpC family hydrolase